jgi:hypothetical protein
MTTTLTHQRETTHEMTIPMPRVTPTASPLPPMQLSEQTLAWLAERPHALHHVRSVWAALTESAERPDLVATLRAILIDHHFLTRTGRCHACRGNWPTWPDIQPPSFSVQNLVHRRIRTPRIRSSNHRTS